MEKIFNPIEIRVLGSLIEKELTTPEYYPLTLNSLTSACNQKSNRNPVMNLDENSVQQVLDELRFQKLIWQVTTTGGRVPKYKHNINNVYDLDLPEISIMCELFLRGYQTLGELRTHTARFYDFKNLEEVEMTLQKLKDKPAGSYVVKLPRERGRREQRFAHLFCGEVSIEKEDTVDIEVQQNIHQIKNEQIEALKNEIEELKREVGEIKEQFNIFKKQFE